MRSPLAPVLLAGCCPDHQPDRRVVPLEQLMAPEPRKQLVAVLEAALTRLTECLGGGCSGAGVRPRGAVELGTTVYTVTAGGECCCAGGLINETAEEETVS